MPQQFWQLKKPASDDRAEWDHPKMDLEQVTCPVSPGHRRSGRRLTELSVVLAKKRVDDLVWTWQSELLVQDRVLVALRDHGLTGFTAKKAYARFKGDTKATPPRLWEIQVTGWGGMAVDGAGIRLIQHCPACRYFKYSVADPTRLVDPAQWDGSDFFMVWPLPRYVFVSDRAAALLKRSGFKGFTLIPAAEIRLKSGDTVTPGRLSNWMPKERAELLGGPLGIA
ncbi:MAG: double-CXXCG motif protein [Rhodospirillales bacterium]